MSLQNERDRLQRDLEKTQAESSRLSGFLGRLQSYGVSPAGQIPHREFAEALIDAVSSLAQADRVVLFQVENATLDLLPAAGRGLAPEALSRLRVRPGEGVLGRAAQEMKGVLASDGLGGVVSPEESFLAAPYMIFPIASQARLTGLLLVAKPQDGRFGPDAKALASLLVAQAALTMENHGFYADLQRTYDQTVQALAQAVEAKDSYTHRHSDRTRRLVRAVAQELHLPEPLIRQIEYGALLHDVGKIGVDDAILKKPGKLTPQEYKTMQQHPEIGERILSCVPFLRPVAAIVLYHQEWYNGAGYPEGLAGEEIPLGARVVQIIDAWDAMTSDRPYRAAMAKSAAIAELRRQAGTQFDPKLVETFLHVAERLEREGIPTTELAHAR